MGTLRFFSTFFICIFLIPTVFAQKGKVEVIGLEEDRPCQIPFLREDKDTGKMMYDSRVWGSPGFNDGRIKFLDGEEISGKIALFTDNQDSFNFIKRCILIIPEGSEQAQYLSRGVAEITIQKKKKTVIYDLYKDGYLERLISGPLRLSYNPDADNSSPISDFVSQSVIDSIRSNTTRTSIRNSMENGKSLQESVGVANMKDQGIMALSSIEIVEKEYLLYVEATGKTYLVTDDTLPAVVAEVFSTCPAFDEKELKKIGKRFKKIRDSVEKYNENCAK